MFFETVEVNGLHLPRFREVPVKIQESTEVTETDLKAIADLMEKAFWTMGPQMVLRAF